MIVDSHHTHLLLLLFLLLLPMGVGAQVVSADDATRSYYNRLRTPSPITRETKNKREGPVPTLKSIPVDDTNSLLYNEDRSFVYLGSTGVFRKKSIPDGYGMSRIIVQDRETGERGYLYCLCPWVREQRQGDAVIKLPNGTYCKAIWKWDNLKSIQDDAPSPEEIAQIEKYITRLTILLKWL